MPKVVRDRNGRYGGEGNGIGGGNKFGSNNNRGILKHDLFEGPYASTPLVKNSPAPPLNYTLSPLQQRTTTCFNSMQIQPRNEFPGLFRTLAAQASIHQLKAITSTTLKTSVSVQKNIEPKPKPELMKDNMTELNKKFLLSCIEILKEDNSCCLAPVVCDYLMQTMNIINQIQIKAKFPHKKDLVHDIRKLVTRMNGKYFEIKSNQEKIKDKIKNEFGKNASNKFHSGVSSQKPACAYSVTAVTRKRLREEEGTPLPALPSIFSLFNGDSPAEESASTYKRVRKEPTSSNEPTYTTCNGLPTPQKDILLSFGASANAKQELTPNSTSNNWPANSSPKSSNTSIGSNTFQLKPVNETSPTKGLAQDLGNQRSPGLGLWPQSGSNTKLQEFSETNNLSWGISGSSPAFSKFPTTSLLNDGNGSTSVDAMKVDWNVIKTPTSTTPVSQEGNDVEEDSEPPKHEFERVVEKEALYSKRCKLFEKRDGIFKDRGVGVLYINMLETGKYQVLIRADNNLGTIILNMLLHCGLPVQKNGRNNVLTVDPSGDGGKGSSILIRVKTSEDADELIEKLNEFKR